MEEIKENIQKIKPTNRVSLTLPLAFDDSLSYLEMTGKLVAKINELIDFCNGHIDESIKEYIKENFSDIVLKTLYDAETETLVLYLDEGGVE